MQKSLGSTKHLVKVCAEREVEKSQLGEAQPTDPLEDPQLDKLQLKKLQFEEPEFIEVFLSVL